MYANAAPLHWSSSGAAIREPEPEANQSKETPFCSLRLPLHQS